LSSTAGITNDATADVTVTGNAAFSGTSVDLNAATAAVAMDFGSLTFNSAAAVTINQTSAMVLSGTSTANSLTLTSTGSITNDGTADVTVTNNANFSANGGAAAITLDDTYAFGSLTFAGSTVTISETDGTTLAGTNSASTLTLT